MRRLAVIILVALAGASGCDLGSADDHAANSAAAKPTDPLHTYEGRVIRGWLLALDRMDYDQAAYYFAPNAVIDQGHPYHLHSESEARAFNAALPCRATLVDLEDEGATVLASFRLRRGPGGSCSGMVRVRYTIEKGKFKAWHQLRDEDAPGQRST